MFGTNSNNMGLWNPSTDNRPLPMIYRVKYVKGEWQLEPAYNKFTLPNKLYGNIIKHATRIWTSFDKRDKSLGVLLVGLKGSGKTETSRVLSNIALEHGMPVIMVAEVRPDLKLIKFLSDLHNVVLFIDEYGKLFNGQIQEKSLTMFSDIGNNKKLFILTENDMYLVNRFLLNRPGRLWYNIHYGRLSEDVVKEYCTDNNVKGSFLKDLLDSYKTSKEFTFDHLQALVIEHLDYPDESLKDLVEIMNIELGNNNMIKKIISIKPIDNKDIRLVPAKRKYQLYSHLPDTFIDINTHIVKVVDVNGKDLSEDKKYTKYLHNPIRINNQTRVEDIIEDDVTYKVNDMLVTVRKMEDNGEPEETVISSNTNNGMFGRGMNTGALIK